MQKRVDKNTGLELSTAFIPISSRTKSHSVYTDEIIKVFIFIFNHMVANLPFP